ncbi:MAG: hypothetical protein EB147_00400 [Acidimicrobiia bacterium]|nr:hypothetical protein [Acidimicrobiia bacterium]
MNNTHFDSPNNNIGPDSQQRGIGALIGACVGDALGAPFEFGPSHAFSTRFPTPLLGTSTEMIGGGAFDWAPGEFTDDSQMMLALAESLLACGSLDLDDVWARFRAWRSGATDCGTTTAGALAHEDRHDAAAEVHRTWGRTASNGALMRTWAIALAYVGHDTSDVMTIARTQAELTHFDPLAGWSLTVVHGSFTNPTGRSSYRYADLLDTARLLLGRRRASRTRLEEPAHPQRVDDEVPVFASDLGGAIECDGDFATVSLCLIDGRLDHHTVRRELYMRDEVGHDENVNLLAAVEDAVSTVDALLADGHRVLVHCHGGRSRTGLVLKAWAMRRYGFTEVEAHEWLEQRWYRYAPWNTTFTEFLRDTWEPKVRV